MSKNSGTVHDNFLSSLISEIKEYSGKDPLLPWLRGIRKMKDTLPPHIINEKLPRFLQKCAQTFQTDRRYANDLRYLRVWLQLMDFVDDPKTVLKTMEANRIGVKKSLYFQAYALYYEKMKKFEAAERMYHLGVQNLAEPLEELQKSYDQFLQRMEEYKNKKNREGKTRGKPLSLREGQVGDKGNKESLLVTNCSDVNAENLKSLSKRSGNVSEENRAESSRIMNHCSDDTVVVKFVDTALVGKSDAEDARHHGLVEPTINTKEAMNAINDMFREPLDIASRRSRRDQSKKDRHLNDELEIFIDEKLKAKDVQSCQNSGENSTIPGDALRGHQPEQEPFQIYIDDDEENGNGVEMVSAKNKLDHHGNEQNTTQKENNVSSGNFKGFVFPHPLDVPLDSSKSTLAAKLSHLPFKEDTVVYKFVGSTISSEPRVENVCHHGLVEPTVNLKEAMDDINSMFGKPIEFVRQRRSKRRDEANPSKSSSSGFVILPDDELDQENEQPIQEASTERENDLFEQTICTKEAMDEINKMFGMPLDF